MATDVFWVLYNMSRHLFVSLRLLLLTRPEPLFTCNQCTISPACNSEVGKWPASVMLLRLGNLHWHWAILISPVGNLCTHTHYLKSVSNYALWKDVKPKSRETLNGKFITYLLPFFKIWKLHVQDPQSRFDGDWSTFKSIIRSLIPVSKHMDNSG